MIMVPIFVVVMMLPFEPWSSIIGVALFIIASITDMLDGKIARKYGLITNFGKFLDPLADKALVMAALLAFVELDWVGSVPVMIILFREFMVSALRLVVSSDDGTVVAAGWSGKLKTAFTMIALIVIMLLRGLMCAGISVDETLVTVVSQALIWISTALTVYSGMEYLKAYWHVIDTNK